MKIAALVSGGVDSAVALELARRQGHEVTAFYLKIWLEEKAAYLGQCPWEEDLLYVQSLTARAGVPLQIVNLQEAYWQKVVTYLLAEARAGRTPNPDILCNQQIKFGSFFEAIGQEYDKIITGHYAEVREESGDYHLLTTPDPIKDQTYFLAFLNQAQLARTWFPLAGYTKAEIRALADQFDLPNKHRPDSQGICFLGKIKYREFLNLELGKKSGALVEWESGKIVGQHDGFWFYTRGQRQNIRLSGGPWFVVKKDPAQNIVYISKHYRAEDWLRNQFSVTDLHWIVSPPLAGQTLRVKVRHGPHAYPCHWDMTEGQMTVQIDGSDQGLAEGQFAVFYADRECLGGGVITG